MTHFSPQIISPIDGDIVIFPSYLWHEVSSVSFGNRITMPFDVFYDLD
jgi:predicted 2-oxoglutarate/Fe(II)-dependent dioxygenase YbiX